MSEGDSHHRKGQSGFTATALFGLCPRCSAKGVWAGPATLAQRCCSCRIEFERYEPRGRGMYVVILPIAILLVLAALKLDDIVQLPVWALIGLWGVTVPTVVIATMRYAKAIVLMARLDKEGLI